MDQHRTIIEPFKIRTVEPLTVMTRKEREPLLAEAGYNLFMLPAKYVTFDFLTDSGTTAMSSAQMAAMMVSDESYAGSRSFARFEAVVRSLTGHTFVIPTHQGRAAERILCAALVKPGMKIPSNNHFDTTRANIEYVGAEAVDLVVPEGRAPSSTFPFKGNIDLERLRVFLQENRGTVPFGMITLTNNTGGGQPASLQNIREVSKLYKEFGVPFIIDACRFAENAYLIKQREPQCHDRTARDIAMEIFSLADGCYMSGKKDALVNIGGFIALHDKTWVEQLRSLLILTEGFPTYGGLAARDLEAMAVGLEEVLDEKYLSYRVSVTRYMAEGLNKLGVPTLQPPGGHAVYIDAKAFLPHIPAHEFPGQSLVCELYLAEGVRSCEIGSSMFGKRTAQGDFIPASMELVRLAFPRRVYTQSHFDYILEGISEVVSCKESLRGLKLEYDPPFLRHFTARFSLL
jgi:tyrosine phenol-lyase